MIPLTIELVPSTAWWSNVRSNVSRADWEKCKRYTREKSGGRCEICGSRGIRWATEAHEVWNYDDENGVQGLLDLIALCPACHQVKHMGRTEVIGDGERALAHLAKVNQWPLKTAVAYRDHVFKVWALRSQREWELDITFLAQLGIDPRVNDRKAGKA